MRKVNTSEVANVEALKQWIEKVGVEQFTKSSKGRRQFSETRTINDIAWAIARSSKRKRKRWYNQYKGREVYSLYFTILGNLQTHVLREAKENYQSSIL